MFLNHFPKHEYQDFQIGTISVRHKDCAALQSVTYFKSQHGVTLPRFARWLWVSCLATEFVRIFKEGNEIDVPVPGSYMPYFMEFKLSTKSPYSTTVNSNIHYFIHCVGSASGRQRSKNARYLSSVQVESVTQVFAYAFKLTVTFDAQFSTFGVSDKTLKKDKPDVMLMPHRKNEPKTKIGKDWLRYVQSYQGA